MQNLAKAEASGGALPPRQRGRGRQVRSSRVKHELGHCARHCRALVLLFVLLLSVHPQKGFDCLRISSIWIPAAIANGSQTTLECNYELGPGDQLYSVTWYKDRAGFYRYQPVSGDSLAAAPQDQTGNAPVEQPGQNLNSNYQSQQYAMAGEASQQANAKHAFDWAGISLDLAKSNATHVHLKQVTLSSEGSYECEVIAEAPTFATVSASRTMRVYVLPKRKLYLADNRQPVVSSPSSVQSSLSDQSGDQLLGQQQSPPPPPREKLYQPNDLLNFTCVSWQSRPAARISWLINNLPSSALLPTSSTLNLDHSPDPDNSRHPALADLLAETRSNLVLHFQPAHFRQLQEAANQYRPKQRGSSQRPTLHNQHLPVDIDCYSALKLEFTSNTSLLISNGKTSQLGAAKRSRSNQPTPELVQPSSIESEEGALTEAEAESNNSRRLDASGRRRPPQLAALATGDGFITRDLLEQADLQTSSAGQADSNDERLASVHRWQPPQLSPLSRFGARSGERDHRLLVATSGGQESNQYYTDLPKGAGPLVLPTPGKVPSVWTNKQLLAQSDAIREALEASRPNELEPAHIEARTVVVAREPVEASDSASSSSSSTEEESLSVEADGQRSHSSSRDNNDGSVNDFELYQLINFTCLQSHKPRPGGAPVSKVRLVWFLNDLELTGGLVNAYDSERGFHFDSNATRTKPSDRKRSNQVDYRDLEIIYPASRRPNATSRSLLVEFSPSLFRLKELNLRCKTIVEEVLIEYMASQTVYLAPASPYIQAQDQQHQPGGSRPSLYNQRQRQQANLARKRQNQANVIRVRQQQQQQGRASAAPSSASSSGAGCCRAHLLAASTCLPLILTALGAALSSQPWPSRC